MQNPTEPILDQLRRDYPGWTFWAVPRAVGGFIWCAQPADAPSPVLSAFSHGELEQQIGAQP